MPSNILKNYAVLQTFSIFFCLSSFSLFICLPDFFLSIFLQFSIDSLLLTVFPCYFSEPELPDAGGGQPLIGLDHEQAQGLIQSAVE